MISEVEERHRQAGEQRARWRQEDRQPRSLISQRELATELAVAHGDEVHAVLAWLGDDTGLLNRAQAAEVRLTYKADMERIALERS